MQTKTSKARLSPSTVGMTARRRRASTPSSMSWSRVHESSNGDIGRGCCLSNRPTRRRNGSAEGCVLERVHCCLITRVHSTTQQSRHSTDCASWRFHVVSSQTTGRHVVAQRREVMFDSLDSSCRDGEKADFLARGRERFMESSYVVQFQCCTRQCGQEREVHWELTTVPMR